MWTLRDLFTSEGGVGETSPADDRPLLKTALSPDRELPGDGLEELATMEAEFQDHNMIASFWG